jgi:hypothetical protein
MPPPLETTAKTSPLLPVIHHQPIILLRRYKKPTARRLCQHLFKMLNCTDSLGIRPEYAGPMQLAPGLDTLEACLDLGMCVSYSFSHRVALACLFLNSLSIITFINPHSRTQGFERCPSDLSAPERNRRHAYRSRSSHASHAVAHGHGREVQGGRSGKDVC